jgi:hypothetical protein
MTTQIFKPMFNAKGQRVKGSKRQPWLFLFVLLCPFVPLSLCVEKAQSQAASQSQFSIRWTPDPASSGKVNVEVSGLSDATLKRLQQSNWKPPQWQRLLSVYAGQGSDQSLPPMLGAYRVQSGALRFEPQFPLEPGVAYRAVFRPDQLPGASGSKTAPITADFKLPPRNATPTTVVSQIYPSASLLPENLLKFYVHFSAPMSRGRIYDHIHLRDEAGKEVELPFLEIDEELWDPAMTRLTLIIDPGRIKRGVLPLEEIGPALETGKSYTLVIAREWRDGAGIPLKENYQKVFKVGPPDREPLDHTRWRIQPPKVGARDALAVTFTKPMDHALAQRVISVITESGEVIEGKVELEDQERRWTFVPDSPWRRGQYKLVIQTTIEDLAGNNIGKPFEVDLFEGVQRRLNSPTVKLSFEIL